ncbi:MAG: IS21 family transposase [Candidatus Paracaedibacteraceae bacterium]|nr:IS21 family transposase [Candidatus Paracaedibacteraceae bacterium]
MLKQLGIKEDTLQPQVLEGQMLKEYHHKIIKELYAKGVAKREIARTLGVDIKTVRRHLKQSGWQAYRRKQKEAPNLLQEEQLWLIKRMPEVNYNATILFRELKAKGYKGSYETVKVFTRPHRPSSLKGCVRYETAPAQQSQVDWGSAWVWLDDKQVKVHFFALVLGYSRRLYVKAFLDEKFANLVSGHEAAFQWFGGLTREILYDNAKTMITIHNPQTGELLLNSAFKDFTEHYGFEARFCRPYRPQTKGKIESGVKYVKRNFLPGRRFKNLTHLNCEIEKWIVEVADERLHGTTHQRPSQRFCEEKLLLINRIQPYYVYIPAIQRKVSQDSMVSFAGNRYSVPWLYVGHCVDLRISQNQLLISTQGKIIAMHEMVQGKHQVSICQQHYAGLLHRGHSKQQKLPQHDSYWQTEVEVETRDLAIYDSICLMSSHSLLKH